MDASTHSREPRALLRGYHRAMLDKNADALAELYAIDGVHEFPLLSPFFPQRLNGKEAIRKHYGAVWDASPFRILAVRDVAVHDTSDSQTIVAEAEFTALATETDKTFSLAFVVVMRTHLGLIAHLRDYMDVLGAAVALNRSPVMVNAPARREAASHRL